jgi:serine protease Do
MKNRNVFTSLYIVLIIFLSIASNNAYAQYNLPDFTELVEEHADAVVNISTSKQTEVRKGLPPGIEIPEFPEGSPFGDFFEKFFGEHGGNGEEFFNSRSLGSGFIISSDGYVITNHHVVKGADEIIVKLSDRRQLIAELVGSDSRSDIALLKLEGSNFPSVKMGNSDDLKVGQWVLAIGSPFGFDASVTAGIVSAKGRSLPSENYVPFIQTDVAINPGNSGGPLFDLEGNVVGINSQIYTRSGGFMGLSFAIPIKDAMDVVEQLKTTGYVSRGWIGVYIQEVTRELAESFGMEKPMGALVAKILEDSPAQDTDLQIGDIILSYDGKEIKNSASLPPMVGRTRVGETVKLKIMRDGRTKTIKLKIGQLPDKDQTLASKRKSKDETEDTVFGLVLRPLSEEEMENLELEKNGLLVLEVHSGAAKSAGVRKGDVIQMINGESVESIKDFSKLVESLPEGKFVSMLVQRSHGPEFLAMRVPEKQ